jgi:hypothetical protein
MRLLSFLFVLALAGQPMKLNSCGWDWNAEEYRFWLLQPELAGSRPLHAFYFTTELLNGPDYHEIVTLPYEANLNEWKAVVGTSVPADDIAAILYGMEPVDYFRQEAELFRTNKFMVRLKQLQGGWPEFISYAKRCEQLVNSDDPWGFIEHDGAGIRKAWKDGELLLKAAKHPQLRARLAFQLVRLAHHGHDPQRPDLDARSVYEKHLAPLRGKSWMEPSAAFYLAGMLENPQRDLAFAEIFERATDKQFRMVQLFASGEVEYYLPSAKDDKHRASLMVMRDLQHPGRALEDLERIAAWDPGNRHLPLLLTREVNKLEDWLLTPVLTEFDAAIRQWREYEDVDPPVLPEEVIAADLDYLHKVKRFIQRITPQAAPEQRPLLMLLDGHLSFVAGDLDDCRAIIERLEQDPQATPLLRAQARLDKILCGAMSSTRLNKATQQDILALVELMNVEPVLFVHRSTLLGQLHLYLGKKLIERGELPEGVFLLARSNRMFGTMLPVWYSSNARHIAFQQATPTDFDRMIALLDKADKTPFERYLTATDERPEDWERTEDHFKSTGLTREKLLDYKGMWYLRENRLEEAAAAFRLIPDDFWSNYEYNYFDGDDPFVVNIEDPHNYGKSDSANYTRRSIVERMIALQNEADMNPKKRALNHYLLGNAYYNMSWHGKYWGLSRIAWSMHDMSDWRGNGYGAPGDDDYFGCARAREHYIKAIGAAKDPVLKAMAVRMAGECEKNWLAYTGQGMPGDRENPHVSKLSDHKSRAAYREIEECTGYADFVARFR